MVQSLSNRDFISGEILLFDKPLDWTSFDVVNRVRYALCQKLGIKKLKVGHAGTLDPKASGLVVLCTGKATKKIESIQATEKEYIATLKIGATTPSYDLETEEDNSYPFDHVTSQLVEEKIQDFIGEINQVPPIFSAIKIKGKRAFNYARNGEELKMKSRKVEIFSIEIKNFELPYLTIKVNCGKGTYIRSLARDIGENIGSGAYLTSLRRTGVGHYCIENAFTMESFTNALNLL
jgi:tRNA pseudouridine55 synthase